MASNRRTILHLVALGRITPAEAERLLVLWDQGRETFWAVAGGVVIALLLQFNLPHSLAALAHHAHALLPASLHHALSFIFDFSGGLL
jgi:hypothetical protein